MNMRLVMFEAISVRSSDHFQQLVVRKSWVNWSMGVGLLDNCVGGYWTTGHQAGQAISATAATPRPTNV